jgi:hypothetical protein
MMIIDFLKYLIILMTTEMENKKYIIMMEYFLKYIIFNNLKKVELILIYLNLFKIK